MDHDEVEVRILVKSKEWLIHQIEVMGGRFVEQQFQNNIIFDKKDALLKNGKRLRLRIINEGAAILTFKGPYLDSDLRVKHEIETAVGNGADMKRILEALGYKQAFLYEKKRRVYKLRDSILSIDELPIGTFLEIEGGSVKKIMKALGFTIKDTTKNGYRELYVAWCMKHKRQLNDMMVFE